MSALTASGGSSQPPGAADERLSFVSLKDAASVLLQAVHQLNQAHATELSECDESEFARLVGRAFFAEASADGAAFMIAFDQDAQYGSPNFLWFRERYPRFVYIDRVAVASAARRRGLGRALYARLAKAALAAGHDLLCCEVNELPPNPGSDALHEALGFAGVGKAELPSGKAVRYLSMQLRPDSAMADPTGGEWLHSLDDIMARLPDEPADDRYHYPLLHGSMRAGIYAPRGRDGQTSHEQDELYIVIAGHGQFVRGGERRAFKAGDLIFVPARTEHRFTDFSQDFCCWVVFWGAVGGE
jgi:predicted GNAT superfamily acetyltransferase/mannose-6-phosphate isomerase-like protein (cupin superfamily)